MNCCEVGCLSALEIKERSVAALFDRDGGTVNGTGKFMPLAASRPKGDGSKQKGWKVGRWTSDDLSSLFRGESPEFSGLPFSLPQGSKIWCCMRCPSSVACLVWLFQVQIGLGALAGGNVRVRSLSTWIFGDKAVAVTEDLSGGRVLLLRPDLRSSRTCTGRASFVDTTAPSAKHTPPLCTLNLLSTIELNPKIHCQQQTSVFSACVFLGTCNAGEFVFVVGRLSEREYY
ncbi:hypothetical protein BC835DRAFT_285251 [Cytidiella melzeri]|nr:hypothetical protein BC835DRAFT_285251 [Cytidiella melzeri]